MRNDRIGALSADVCVFDDQDHVFCAISAITFTHVRRTSLARNLASLNSSTGLAEKAPSAPVVGVAPTSDATADKLQQKHGAHGGTALSTIIFNALSSVTGTPQANMSQTCLGTQALKTSDATPWRCLR
jgi:hypothetical protein